MNATWRLVSVLTTIVNRLIVIALIGGVAWDLLAAAEGASVLERGIAWMRGHQDLTLAVVAVLALLNFGVIQFLIYAAVNAPRRSYIHSKTAGGNSRVALSAVQDALQTTARQVPEIAKPRIKVLRTGRHRYRIHIRYMVKDVVQAGNAAEHLRLVLKKRFSDLVVLDPKDRVEFDLDLSGLVKQPGTGPKELRAPRDESFHGPVYPVGGDDDA